jgi:hypothetical protein
MQSFRLRTQSGLKTLQSRADFLQKNAGFLQSAAYKTAFDEQTVKTFNNWEQKHDGMIDKMLSKFPAMILCI